MHPLTFSTAALSAPWPLLFAADLSGFAAAERRDLRAVSAAASPTSGPDRTKQRNACDVIDRMLSGARSQRETYSGVLQPVLVHIVETTCRFHLTTTTNLQGRTTCIGTHTSSPFGVSLTTSPLLLQSAVRERIPHMLIYIEGV